jgi:hypothetical protein
MNYLGESEFTPDIKSILERLAVLEADQPIDELLATIATVQDRVTVLEADLPSACLIQNTNPLATALFASSMGNDAVVRPLLASVPFDLPGEWPAYFSRTSTSNVAVYENNACHIGLDEAGWYSVDGSVTLVPNKDCHIQINFSSYTPGQSIADWVHSSTGDEQVCLIGTKYEFNFTDLVYLNAQTVIEMTSSHVNVTADTSVDVYKYRLSVTRV